MTRVARETRKAWSTPTAWLERFEQAVALLCGQRPPEGMCAAWASHENENLQSWVVGRCPHWAQGIVTIEAAEYLANSPTEGVPHGTREEV